MCPISVKWLKTLKRILQIDTTCLNILRTYNNVGAQESVHRRQWLILPTECTIESIFLFHSCHPFAFHSWDKFSFCNLDRPGTCSTQARLKIVASLLPQLPKCKACKNAPPCIFTSSNSIKAAISIQRTLKNNLILSPHSRWPCCGSFCGAIGTETWTLGIFSGTHRRTRGKQLVSI